MCVCFQNNGHPVSDLTRIILIVFVRIWMYLWKIINSNICESCVHIRSKHLVLVIPFDKLSKLVILLNSLCVDSYKVMIKKQIFWGNETPIQPLNVHDTNTVTARPMTIKTTTNTAIHIQHMVNRLKISERFHCELNVNGRSSNGSLDDMAARSRNKKDTNK